MSRPGRSGDGPTAAESARSRLVAALSVAGIVGPVLFWIVLLVAQALYPSDDPWGFSISTLVFGPYGWVQTVNFYFLMLFTAAFGVAVYLAIARSVVGRISSVLLVTMGIVQMLTAVFHVDVNPSGPDSLAYVIHKMAVIVSAGSFPVAALLLVPDLWSSERWRSFAYLTAAAAAAVFCLDLLWLASQFIRPHLIDSWFGAYERILLSIPLAWTMIMSARLLYLNRSSRRA